MKKRCILLVFCYLCLSFLGNIQAQIYQVQLAAFTEEISPAFFAFAGYNHFYAEKDHNNFTRYTLGEFYTLEAAKAAQQKAISSGFSNTHIIELDQPLFAYMEDSHKLPLLMVPEKEALFIRSVRFSAEDLSFSKELLNSLEEALAVMKQHPQLKLRIVGHTDDIGEKAHNQAISKKRVRMIQNFLLASGIPAYRLKMKVSETPSPEVYFKGKGLPKTRDFNRRIIMTLVDVKEEIVIDKFQQQNVSDKNLSLFENPAVLLKFINII